MCDGALRDFVLRAAAGSWICVRSGWREFLLQFSWENRNLEIMTDYGRRETVTLGELMPVCLSGVHTLREKVCIAGVKWIFYNQLFKWTFLGEI